MPAGHVEAIDQVELDPLVQLDQAHKLAVAGGSEAAVRVDNSPVRLERAGFAAVAEATQGHIAILTARP